MSNQDLWLQVREKIKNNPNMDIEIYNSFLVNSSLKVNENEYILIIKSKLGAKLVEQYRDIIINEIKTIIGHLVVLTIQTEANYKKNDVIKPVQSEKINGLNFQNFIIGPSNKQAFLASQAIYKDPGSKFNPLFIYGDSGLGKTHLLKGIYNEFAKNKPEIKVIYLESNDFVKQIINVLTGDFKEIEKFKNEICKNDILIIDDIQFLANKDKTNEFFFSIFNTFVDNNKQIVFSSDKSPDLLNGFDKRMITRFNSGLVAPIKKLDFETSHIIFEYELTQNNIKSKIDEESINYLINYFTDDVRKIKGIINQLRFYIDTETVDNLTIKTITELFKDTPSSNLSGLNVKKIKETVGNQYGISVSAIDGTARNKEITNARHLSMFLVKEILNHSLSQIGVEFGGKDHTTVMSAVNKIEKQITDDKMFKNTVEILKNKILLK